MQTLTKRNRPKTSKKSIKWKDEFLFTCCLLAAEGASDGMLATSLGVSSQTFSNWKRKNKLLQEALKKGKQFRKDKAPTFRDKALAQLPPNLKDLFLEIERCATDDSLYQRVKATTADLGKKGRQQLFLAAWYAYSFNMTEACYFAGVRRDTMAIWLREDLEFSELFRMLDEIRIDFYESKLTQAIASGDTAATIFAMRTKGRNRGYSEKIEVDINTTANNTNDATLSVQELMSRVNVQAKREILKVLREHKSIQQAKRIEVKEKAYAE